MVAQAGVVEEHARDHEWPGERAAPRLISAGDEADTQSAVEPEELLTGAAHEGRGYRGLRRQLCRKRAG